jgi:hypothetical protein
LLIIKLILNRNTTDILERIDVHFISLSSTYNLLTFSTLLNLNYGSNFGAFMNEIYKFYSNIHISIIEESPASLEGKYAFFETDLYSLNAVLIPVGIFAVSLLIRVIVNLSVNKKNAVVERIHNLVTLATFARSMVAMLINVVNFSTDTTWGLISSIISVVFTILYILEAVRIGNSHFTALIAKNREGDSRLVYFAIIVIRFLLISILFAALGTKYEEIVAWTTLIAVIASSVIIMSLSKPKKACLTSVGKMTTRLSFTCEVATIILAVTLVIYSLDPNNKLHDTLSSILEILSIVAFCTIVIAAAINFFANAYLVFDQKPKKRRNIKKIKENYKCEVGFQGEELTVKNKTHASKSNTILGINSKGSNELGYNNSMKKAPVANKPPKNTKSKVIEYGPLDDMNIAGTRKSSSKIGN